MVSNKKIQNYIIIVSFVISIMYSLLEIVSALWGQATSESTSFLWSVIFALIIALWTSNDAKSKDLYIPYEYSYFVFFFGHWFYHIILLKLEVRKGFLCF